MEITKGHIFFKSIDKAKVHKRLHEDVFPFSQNLMWDYPLQNIDIKKHRRYIIERVMTRGFMEDFYVMLQLYSKREIQESLKKSKELDKKTVHFCSYYFDIPKEKLNVSLFYCD